MTSLASRLPNLSRDNISLHLLGVLWFLGIAGPRNLSRRLWTEATGRDYDVVNPRTFGDTVAKDSSLDEKTRLRILRCEGAITNHHENFPIFASALVAGNAAGLSPKVLNGLTLAYVASRAVYTAVYIWSNTFSKAILRPLTFFTGAGMWITLFVKAGNKFSKAASGN